MGLIDDLKPGPLALDTQIFSYFIEEDGRYLTSIKPLFEAIDRGDLLAVTSGLRPIAKFIPTGVLARDQSTIARQLLGTTEALDGSKASASYATALQRVLDQFDGSFGRTLSVRQF